MLIFLFYFRYSDFVKAMSPLNESYSKILHNREPHYIEPYEDGLRVDLFIYSS